MKALCQIVRAAFLVAGVVAILNAFFGDGSGLNAIGLFALAYLSDIRDILAYSKDSTKE